MHAPSLEARAEIDRRDRALLVKRVAGWGLIAFAALQALWFVRRFGVDVLFWDEWERVPWLWSPLSASDLWAQQNEHRIPVGAIVLQGLYRATSVDTRAGMYASFVCLAIIVAILMAWYRRAIPGGNALTF